ncbi:MAG: LURP-one-related family protein [Solobacterium sp.]|nr:LURP-one-related family protein [Solobacterium sp.]
MKLYLRQNPFSRRDRFQVTEQTGRKAYTIEGALFAFTKQFAILDSKDKEAAVVKEKALTLSPQYLVESHGRKIAEIIRKPSLIGSSYAVKGPGWQINGDFQSHVFVIRSGAETIARITKRWMTQADIYEIQIRKNDDALLVLACALVIDAVQFDEKKK